MTIATTFEVHVPTTRVTSHSSLSEIVHIFEAPPVKKETRMKPVNTLENRTWTKYHVSRMKSASKIAQSPDMNLSLNEILTRERVSDKIAATLFVYTLGVFLIFFLHS
jgi:hypothetical protein